jgi:hypothetical protein
LIKIVHCVIVIIQNKLLILFLASFLSSGTTTTKNNLKNVLLLLQSTLVPSEIVLVDEGAVGVHLSQLDAHVRLLRLRGG